MRTALFGHRSATRRPTGVSARPERISHRITCEFNLQVRRSQDFREALRANVWLNTCANTRFMDRSPVIGMMQAL